MTTSLTRPRRILLVLLTILLTVGCDQATKAMARDQLTDRAPLSFAGDVFRLQHAENTGAFLGFGAWFPDPVRVGLFTVGSALLLGWFLVWVLRARRMGAWTTLAIALFCGGGLGNLLDRVFRDGRVTDFLNLGVGSLRTGIFNVADLAITTGLVMLFVGGWRRRDPRPAP